MYNKYRRNYKNRNSRIDFIFEITLMIHITKGYIKTQVNRSSPVFLELNFAV